MRDRVSRGNFTPEDSPDTFWSTIAQANRDRAALRRILMSMTREEIIDFYNDFEDAATELTEDPFFQYQSISEDSMLDIAKWVVSQGKEFYSEILQFPHEMPQEETEEMVMTTLAGVAGKVFGERFKEAIPYRLDERDKRS